MAQGIEEPFRPVLRDLVAAGLSARLKADTSGMRDGLLRADLSAEGQRIGHLAGGFGE